MASMRGTFLRRCSFEVSANKLFKRWFSLIRALYLSFLCRCLIFMMLSAMEQQNQVTIASDISIVNANAHNPSTSSMTNTLQVTPLTNTEHSSFLRTPLPHTSSTNLPTTALHCTRYYRDIANIKIG